MQTTTKEIQLTLCEKCNLNCIYCYEYNKDGNIMTFDTAKEIITNEFNLAKSRGYSLLFSFHGGEIAIVFELLKNICEWMWDIDWGVKYHCSAATNGTLIHGDIQNWFSLHAKSFTLCLSLDGNKEMHNINRSNSYSLIDFDFFRNTYPNQLVKMTISPKTINMLYEGVVDIVKKGFRLTANLAYGCDWDSTQLKKNYANQLLKLSEFFINNPEYQPPYKLMNMNLTNLGICLYKKSKPNYGKGCGAGEHLYCYDSYGEKHPCQMFMPSSAGTTCYKGIQIEDEDITLSKECIKCPINMLCSPCCGFNYNLNKDFIRRRNSLCDYYIIECLNYSYFLFQMLKSKSKYRITENLSDSQIAVNLKAIEYLQKEIPKLEIIKYIV